MYRFLIILALYIPAWACSCSGYPSAKEAWLDSPLVFAGFVDETDPKLHDERRMSGEQTAWVRVSESFKGAKTDQVFQLRDEFSSCFGGFREGKALLFYLRPGKKEGTWVAPACGRTKPIESAADDLQFLRGLPASARGNRVSGTVKLWRDDLIQGALDSQDLGGVSVRAQGISMAYDTATNAQGLYEFRNLQPGTYTIQIGAPKGTRLNFPIAYGRTNQKQRFQGTNSKDSTKLEVSDESSNGFDFILSPDTRISGRVLDPEERPMKGVCLEIDPLQGDSQKPSRFFSCTKADGSYVLERMPEGSYRIVANRSGQITATEPFGRLYYPGTPEINKADVLSVTAGQHLNGIDIHLSQLARLIELSGRFVFNDGIPLPDQSLSFSPDDGGRLQYAKTDANGNFTMQILAGRPGTLKGQISIWRGQEMACPQFAAKLEQENWAVYRETTLHIVASDKSAKGIELVLPFPSCEAWLRGKAEQKIR